MLRPSCNLEEAIDEIDASGPLVDFIAPTGEPKRTAEALLPELE
jgi:hypothetical protein